MINPYLKEICRELFREDFDADMCGNCRVIQDTVYLLIKIGVPVGDYRFRWRNGPYSEELVDDMHHANGNACDDTKIPEKDKEAIVQLRSVLYGDTHSIYTYGIKGWVKCLAAMLYLKENILGFDVTQEDAVSELQTRMPCLSNREANLGAYRALRELGLF